MTVQEKTIELKNLVTLVCEILPIMVTIIKEIITAVKEIKTV